MRLIQSPNPTHLQAPAHPLPLWLHLPAQAAIVAAVRHRTPAMCVSSALQQPASQAATAAVYHGLTALLSLLPLQTAAPQHGPLGQCVAALTLAELLLAFLLPSLSLAVWEARQCDCFCRYWAARLRQEGQEGERQEQQEQQDAAAGPSGSSMPAPCQTTSDNRLSQVLPSDAEEMAAAAELAAGTLEELCLALCPFLQLPSSAAAASYRLLLSCSCPAEVANWAAAAVAATLLLVAAWHVVLLLTPTG